MAAKTTKKTTAKSTAKTVKTAKSPKTTGGISLNSNRGRFIATILIVAIIGGGLFVYRSFASTTATWTYTVANTQLKEASGANNSPCKATVVNEPSKNNTKVINLACSTDGAGATAQTVGASITSALVNRPYRMCAVIKGSGTVGASFTVPGLKSNTQTTLTFYPKADYSQHCTAPIDAQRVGPVTAVVSATKRGTNVRVSSISIEQLSSSYASTSSAVATPAPSKNPTDGKR